MATPRQARTAPPTAEAYSELSKAYDHFNKQLFTSELPPCLITLQRKGLAVMGYYSPDRFGSNKRKGRTVDEIAMNPIWFKGRNITEVMQTLVHEMCHLWQQHCGKPSRRGYHNHEWAAKMIEIGLHPSDSGKPGGNIVGQKMADYLVPGAAFDKALKKLTAKGFAVSWYDRIIELIEEQSPEPAAPTAAGGKPIKKPAKPTARPQTRAKFSCPSCGLNAWAKPSAKLICGECDEALWTSKAGTDDKGHRSAPHQSR